MRHHDSDPHDALNDYLDSLAGAPPAESSAGNLDPDLRDGVDRFFDLAEQAGVTPRASNQPRRPAMATNLTLPASGAIAAPRTNSRRSRPRSRWTAHLHLASTALLIATVIALAFAAFGPNGPGRNGGTGEPSGNLAAVPLATVSPDDLTSTLPYAGPEKCTVEPMTREEMIAHIQEANMATAPEYPRYERDIEPSPDEAAAIIQAYDEWWACGLATPNTGIEYQLHLQTPWYSANQLGVFWNFEQQRMVRPVSEAHIEAYVDLNLAEATPVATIGSPPALPEPERDLPETVPVPAGATPVSYEGGRAFATLFAEDIVITGPNTARAEVYFVDEKTHEVQASGTQVVQFVKVDDTWLIDDFGEPQRG